MSFDGLMMHHLINEYQDSIIHHRIDNIIYVQTDVFALELYHQKQKKLFFIDLHANDNRLYFTDYKKITSSHHQSLSLFKKYLSRSHISDMKQYQTDRVCVITCETFDAFDGNIQYQLIIEMMGKHANLILIKDGLILEAYKKMVHETSRSIAYHLPFSFFPSNKKRLSEFTFNQLDVNDYVSAYEGMSKDLAFEVLKTETNPYELPVVPSMKGSKRYVYHIENGKIFDSINHMMQTTYHNTHNDTGVIDTLIQKRQLKLPKLMEEKRLHESHLNDYLIAETLYTYHDLKANVSRIENIDLDVELTVHENAQRYLKAYNKAKRALPQLDYQILKTQQDLDFLKQLRFDLISNMMTYQDILRLLFEQKFIFKKQTHIKKKRSQPIEIREGHDILWIGKNAVMNAYVTHELARSNDLFFHVKDAPGSHVILRGSKNSALFKDAMKYAAYFSHLRKASKVEVMVAFKKDVKKITGMHGSLVHVKTYTSYMVTLDSEFVKLCESL
ncbi:MAG: Rqc2 family fibronectin-binding protein [Acholeplasmataceae bacterium]